MLKSTRTPLVLTAALCAALCGPALGAQPAVVGEAGRVEALLQQMTLEEKLGQLTQQWGGVTQDVNPAVAKTQRDDLEALIRQGRVGSFLGAHGAEYTNGLQRVAVEQSRLKIPLILGNDVIHGYRTIFPIPLGEASSWDPQVVERAARVAAVEAAAAGTHWTFAPMVDICRDARWGRIAEGAGEDPHLGSVMAAARVRGFQGTDLAAVDTVLACAKHYVAYGAAEAGRDYNTVDISRQTLHEVFLPPFKAAVDAGVGTLMTAFNEISGIPATANHYTLADVLRGKWGFTGFVVSDWTSVTEMVDHGFAVDDADAALKAVLAGTDMDMCSQSYRDHLGPALERGSLTPAVIDDAVRRVLQAKYRLGLFERPYADPEREHALTLSAAHRAAARDVARHAIVLLKNDGPVLPLSEDLGAIAVIGPLADSRADPLGTWAAVGRADDVVSVLEGLRQRVSGKSQVHYARGCGVNDAATDGFAEAVAAARQSDVAVVVVGESADMSGEAHCRTTLGLPGVQRQLLEAVHATGVPVVVVLMHGRPMSIGWTAEHVPAILATWHLGVECGHATADVLFGDFNPGGKLPASFPRRIGQVPIYYYHKNTGRPPDDTRYTSKYIDVPNTPLFPFGYGLSYTRFGFSDLQVQPRRITASGSLTVSVELANLGGRAGAEVVQLYVRDLVGSMTRPVRELKGFERVELAAGDERTVTFTVPAARLGFYDAQMNYVVEPGLFKLWVGPSAVEGLQAEFEVISGK